jgi:hypothetical protein
MHLNHPIYQLLYDTEAGGVCQNLGAYIFNTPYTEVYQLPIQHMEVKVLPYVTAFHPNFQVLSLISHFTLTNLYNLG